MVERTRMINGRRCVMVPGSKKYNSEQEAIEGAKNDHNLTDFEVAQTGITTWRVYTSDEPKVEKPPRVKKEKKVADAIVQAEKAIEKAEEAIEAVAEAEGVSEEKGNEDVGSEESETTPIESNSVVTIKATDITENGKEIIRTIRNCINQKYPNESDTTAGDVAELLGKKVNVVTGALRSLIARDYITTHTDEDGISVICLTQKGWTAAI